MKAYIKEIRKAAQNLMKAPAHSGLVFRYTFGEEKGAEYWSRMARAARDIEAACVKLDELINEMLEHAKRIQREKRAQERAQARNQQANLTDTFGVAKKPTDK
jgi:hypothetical protein